MALMPDLLSAGLIEKDSHGDITWTWAYPSVTPFLRDFYIRKSNLNSESVPVPFTYGQFQRIWYYISTTDVADTDNLPKVKKFSLVLTAKDFNPEKYESLTRIMCALYKETGTPVSILETFLTVMTKGVCRSEENGTFTTRDFSTSDAYFAGSAKDLINTFGVESILIYVAMLLKKRVVVYHPNVGELIQAARAFPALVWERQNWNLLYPNVHLDKDEMSDLQSNTSYVAGFTEASVEGRSDLYDIFVNLNNAEISIAPQAKETFAMGKLHKDIAMYMVQSAEDDSMSNKDVIGAVVKKTKELLNNLKSLATEGEDGKASISIEALRGRNMPPAMENFLYNLAAAEGLVQL
ncbi:DENN domain-containing protein 10-like [Lineus longissimus]|uniref:DENN domain-containing protein 10-like n=1 Tax=Lineus longissimus TaxID=88925 RepID=UPI002B4D2650